MNAIENSFQEKENGESNHQKEFVLDKALEEVSLLAKDPRLNKKVATHVLKRIENRVAWHDLEIERWKDTNRAQYFSDDDINAGIETNRIYQRRVLLEAPYLIRFQAQELDEDELLATFYGVHATSIENMSATLLLGRLLPGDRAVQLLKHLKVDADIGVHSSPHVTKDIRFSAVEINWNYGIEDYPEGVYREWDRPDSECFFAVKALNILENNKGNLLQACDALSLNDFEPLDSLIEDGIALELPLASSLQDKKDDLHEAISKGELRLDDYLQIVNLSRQVIGPFGNLPYREIFSTEAISLEDTVICFPGDFVPVIRQSMQEVAERIKRFDVETYPGIRSRYTDSIKFYSERLDQPDLDDDVRNDIQRKVEEINSSLDFLEELRDEFSQLDISKERIDEILKGENIWSYDPEIPSGTAAFAELSTQPELLGSMSH